MTGGRIGVMRALENSAEEVIAAKVGRAKVEVSLEGQHGWCSLSLLSSFRTSITLSKLRWSISSRLRAWKIYFRLTRRDGVSW